MKTFIYVLAALLLVACNSNEKTTKEDENPDALTLNDGEKWEVNEEMRPFIEQGNEILKAYTAAGETDYKGLAEELKDQNSKLISSCTMKGKSHDELHKWLYPHIKLISSLESAENNEEANEVIGKLGTSFKTYQEYFK